MDVLSDIIDQVRLRGVLYFDTEFHPPWAVVVPTFANVARYHFVTRGQCWIRVTGVTQPQSIGAGDLVVIPHGAEHVLSDDPKTKPLTLDRVLTESGYTGSGCLVYGRGDRGAPTRLVCGHFEFSDGIHHPLVQALPPLIYIPAAAGTDYSWLDQALQYIALEATSGKPGSTAIVKRLSEIVFVQTVRAAGEIPNPALRSVAGYSDPQISRALHALHHAADQNWTVASLAKVSGLSRTRFAVRFRKLLGITPLAYATKWRMDQANKLLAVEGRSVLEIANQVGYSSEAGFNRAYAKHFGEPPRRHHHSAPSAPPTASQLKLKRSYEPAEPTDGFRVLVDRLWPRGMSKRKAAIDLWLKDIAPSNALRRWFGASPKRWPEFVRRYQAELAKNRAAVQKLREAIDAGPVTLVYSKRSPQNNAQVLADFVRRNSGGGA
jgi:AraC family transcriptional regulator, activator of mtrCDE